MSWKYVKTLNFLYKHIFIIDVHIGLCLNSLRTDLVPVTYKFVS